MSKLGKKSILATISAVEKSLFLANYSRYECNNSTDPGSFEQLIKYCKKHGNAYHDTDDWRSLKNKMKENLNKFNTSYNILKIPFL